MLLVQFKETGMFIMKYDEFKRIMEFSNGYRQCDIDKILEKSKEELKEKSDIEITEIKKNKKGRSIDKIEIFFKSKNKKVSDKKYYYSDDEKCKNLSESERKYLDKAMKISSKSK